MLEEKSDLEKVVRAYLSSISANAVMCVIDILEKNGDNEYEMDMEKYLYTPTDVMDNSERMLGITTTVKKHAITLLETLGVMIDEEYIDDTRLSIISDMLTVLTSINSLDYNTSLNLLSIKDEVGTDIEFILKVFNLHDDMEMSYVLDLVRDVSPTLIDSIIDVATNNLEDIGIEPLDLKSEDTNTIYIIVEYLRNKLDITTPDIILRSLFNKGYIDGLNDLYINDLLKPIKLNVERYEDDKLIKYLYSIAVELLFIYNINKEDEPVLLSLDAIQDYLPASSIPELNRRLINVNNIYNTSKIYDYLKDSDE